jgi:hypothetical protein
MTLSHLIQALFKESEDHSNLKAENHVILIQHEGKFYRARLITTRYTPDGDGVITLQTAGEVPDFND